MGFFDAPLAKDTDLKYNRNVINNPILYSDSDTPDIYILIERPYAKVIVDAYVKLIKSEMPELKIQLLSVLSIFVKDSDIKGGIQDFYIQNKIKIEDYIPPYSKVIADRRSVVALNESDDLDVEGFYDIVFNEPYYYNPQYKLTVFPIDPITYWIQKDLKRNIAVIKDKWVKFFNLRQVKEAYKYKVKKTRHKKINLVTVDNPNQWLQEQSQLDIEYVAWDIETNTLDPWHPDARILELTMSFDGITGYYLPWDKIDTKILGDFLRGKKQILQNGKFDAKFLILNGVDRDAIHIYHDTWNGSHVINEMQRSSLKSDAWLYTDMGGYDNELEKYKKRYPECKNDYSKIPVHIRKPYAIKDSIVTFRIFETQVKKFGELTEKTKHNNVWPIEKYFYESVMPTVNMFIDVELEGMLVDWDKLYEHSKELQRNIDEVKKKIWKVFDIPENFINLDSGQELGVFLELNGWPDIGRGKEKPNKKMLIRLQQYYSNVKIDRTKGIYLTGEDPLSKWSKMGYKDKVDLILKYRELNTLMKTFVGHKNQKTGMFQYCKKDNKIHGKFGPMLTHSHRNWSQGPNLQNFPKRGKRARWFREIFNTPGKDFYFVEMDAAGLQLRIGAILSDDKVMRHSFINEDGDLHSTTAASILARVERNKFVQELANGNKEFKTYRTKAKNTNFQLEFGATAYNFAKTVIEKEWTLDECKDYIKNNGLTKRLGSFRELIENENKGDSSEFAYYWTVAADLRKKHFKLYNGLEKWTRKVPLQASKDGYVQSSFGAIRRLPELLYQGEDDNKGHIKNLKNISLNSPVQNYEVVLMMKTMVAINDYIKENHLKSRVIGNVHDSIVMYMHKNELEDIFDKSKEIFEENIPENKGIPMLMEFDIADYYGKGQVWGFGDEVVSKQDLEKFFKN